MRASFQRFCHMKTFGLLTAWTPISIAWLATLPAWSQGTIQLGNYHPGEVDAPVFDSDCTTRLAGTGYLAQWYLGLAPDSLAPVGAVLSFGTGERAGYIRSQYLEIPGTSYTRVFTQLRAWEASAGASFEEAVLSGGKHGNSNVVPLWTVMPPTGPNTPVGLQSFCLVPEPGPGALLALGGGLWLLAARRVPAERCGG